MKYVKEIVIIFGITMVGKLLNKFIPLRYLPGIWSIHSSWRSVQRNH